MGDPAAGQPGGMRGRARHPSDRGWRIALTTALMAAAGGMTVNDFTGLLGYRGLSGVFALAAALAAANWRRTLDPKAPLARYASWLFLITAAASAIIAAFSPGRTAAFLTAIAVIVMTGAVLLSAGMKAVAGPLAGVAATGFAVTVTGGVLVMMAEGAALAAVALTGIGVARLTGWATLAATALTGAGVALTGIGVAVLADGPPGEAFTGAGVAVIAVGVARLTGWAVLAGVVLAGAGALVMGFGIMVLTYGVAPDTLVVAEFIGAGVAVMGLGVAGLTGWASLAWVTFTGLGIAVMGLGMAMPAAAGEAVAGTGVGFTGLAAAFNFSQVVSAVRKLRGGPAGMAERPGRLGG